jgi:hypothetical protein
VLHDTGNLAEAAADTNLFFCVNPLHKIKS